MGKALELRRVSAGYGETVVVEDLDLTLAPGECISVIGRNGVGKTTLLATIMGQTVMHRGDIVLDGASLTRVPSYRRSLAGRAATSRFSPRLRCAKTSKSPHGR